MKKFIKKVSAIAGSALMIGLSMGTAMAANFPSGYSASSTAIVYGANAAMSDTTGAQSIIDFLGTDGGSIVVEGGESFTLEKTSVNFHYGDALNALYPTLDDDEMDFLAEGVYKDGDIDAEYEQEIVLSSKPLGIFSDRDYDNEEATVGFTWDKGDHVLNYTLEFTEDVNATEMTDTEMPFMGAEYYVLSATTTKIELLDSSNKATLAYGETSTIEGKDITVNFISSDGAKFTINGESTSQLNEGEYEELDDGTYVVVTEVLASSLESMGSSVEVAIGSGKIILEDGEEVELNEEDVDDLEVSLVSSSTDILDSITLVWNADDDLFLTKKNSLTMPGFGVVQLAYGGMDYPSDSEVVSIDGGEQLKLNMDNYVLDLMWADNSTNAKLGTEHETLVLATNSTATIFNFTDGEGLNASVNGTAAGYLALSIDDRFLVTVVDDDLSETRTLYYEVTRIDVDGTEFTIELDDLIGTRDLVIDQDDDDYMIEEDDFEITLEGFDSATDANVTTAYLSFSDVLGGTVNYNKAVSDKGLVITLPTSFDGSDAELMLTEADDRGDINQVNVFNITVGYATADNETLHVDSVNSSISMVEESDDVDIGYVVSDLASKVTLDKTNDEHYFEIEYFGEEATADVRVIAGGDVSSNDGIGAVLVKDSEVSTVSSKNLIVVGGSCINSVAARLLGSTSPLCESAFTAKTEIGSGQFLIKSYDSPYATGKTALLVAGYEAADTSNAVTYLRTQDVDMDNVETGYRGTSSTSASLITESA